MTVFFTSDLHLNHEKLAELRGFDSIAEHDDAIVEGIFPLTKHDQLWVLGDLSSGSNGGETRALQILADLKEKTRAEFHLIAGNHDSCHPINVDSHRKQKKFLEVFDSVQLGATRKIAGRRVRLSHFPYSRDHTDTPRHPQWRLPDVGNWLLHGHTHQADRVTVVSDPIPHGEICVGLEAWDMAPVALEVIADIIQTMGS